MAGTRTVKIGHLFQLVVSVDDLQRDWAAERLIAPYAADDLDVVRLDPLAASSPVAALASPQLVVDQIGIDFNAGGVSVYKGQHRFAV